MQPETARPSTGHLGEDAPARRASPEALVDALGMAFATYSLYDDPRSTEAFGRAIAVLGAAPLYPWRLEVGVDGFAAEGEPLAVRREASLRCARRLFALGIAALDVVSPPSSDDVIVLLELLGPESPPADARLALEDAGVRTIRLLDRAMLLAGEHGTDDPEATRAASDAGDHDPAGFVLRMLENGDRDPAAVARRFVEEYERAHLLIDLDDTWGIEELTHAFVDGFWYLPEVHRAEIFSLMLERGHRPENTAFLDQFGGIELAQLNRMFGAGGHPLLAEYLRVAAEEGGRPHDDLEDLVAADPAGSLATRIVGQVASVLGARDGGGATRRETAVDRLHASHPGADDARRSIGNLLQGLLSLAAEEGELAATARTWAGRVTAALAAGDPAAADEWIEAVAGAGLPPDTGRLLAASLAEALSPPAALTLAGLLSGPDTNGPGAAVRRTAPLFAADGLVRALADEAHPGRRKTLLKALQVVGRLRPQTLLPHLADDRWYVVRNVVIALGTSRHPEAAARVERLAAHADHRVRLEALRALFRLQGTAASGRLLLHLGDPDPTVAAEAGRLLSGLADPGIDRALAARAGSDDPDDALVAVAALGRRTTAAARTALAGIAGRPALWGRGRRLKAAARRALEGRDE